MQKSLLARNTACNAIVALVNTGSTLSAGQLRIYTSDSTLISYLPFSNPAFLTAVDGTSVSSPISDATALIDATASTFSVINRDSTVVWTGTVTGLTGHGDLKLNAISIPKDTTVSISQATYIVPA